MTKNEGERKKKEKIFSTIAWPKGLATKKKFAYKAWLKGHGII